MQTSELFQIPMLAGGLLQSALLVGVLLLAMRSARLPFGAVTLLVALPTALMLLMRQRFDADVRGAVMLAVTLAGLAGDVLMARLRPGFERPPRLRLFSALVPALVYAAYYLAVAAVGGVWWSIHLWSGAVFLSGVAGWLVAFLATQQAASRPAEGAAGQLAALGQD
jgi:peptidoglycan/LPS O-acetylase OafA/YrhL